jgi:hypothetical protein
MFGTRNLWLLSACLFFTFPSDAVPVQKPAPQAVFNQAPAIAPNQAPAGVPNRLNLGEPANPLIPREQRSIRPITKPFVVIGEVVDTWCYTSQTMGSGRGAAHKPCALACIGGGVTPGIVDDHGTLYIAAKYKAYTGCKELLMPYTAKRVKVTGWLASKGGCNVIKILKVELVK